MILKGVDRPQTNRLGNGSIDRIEMSR